MLNESVWLSHLNNLQIHQSVSYLSKVHIVPWVREDDLVIVSDKEMCDLMINFNRLSLIEDIIFIHFEKLNLSQITDCNVWTSILHHKFKALYVSSPKDFLIFWNKLIQKPRSFIRLAHIVDKDGVRDILGNKIFIIDFAKFDFSLASIRNWKILNIALCR